MRLDDPMEPLMQQTNTDTTKIAPMDDGTLIPSAARQRVVSLLDLVSNGALSSFADQITAFGSAAHLKLAPEACSSLPLVVRLAGSAAT